MNGIHEIKVKSVQQHLELLEKITILFLCINSSIEICEFGLTIK